APGWPCGGARARSGPFRGQGHRDLDEVEVGVAHVDGADGARGARAPNGSFDDRDAVLLQPGDDVLQRAIGDEAQVEAAGHRQVRLGLDLAALHMQVDLLLAEDEGPALRGRRTAGEGLEPHAQCVDVEAHAGPLVGGGQYEVVEVIDHRAFRRVGVAGILTRRGTPDGGCPASAGQRQSAKDYSLLPPMPRRASRLVNRLSIETYRPTVAIT